MSRKLITYFILLSSISWKLSGQSLLSEERILLFTNTDLLLTGETLFFKLYSQSKQGDQPGLSKVAYVEVVDESAQPVLSARIAVLDGQGSGEFFLPSKLASGNYTLIAYTRWMKNFDPNGFSRRDITIINPFRIQTQANFEATQETTRSIPSASALAPITITANQTTFHPREKAIVRIEAHDESLMGPAIVTVHLGEQEAIPALPAKVQENSSGNSQNTGKYLPEVRGKLISGRASLAAVDSSLVHRNLFLSAPGKEYLFQAARTDKNGVFHFVMEQAPLPGKLVIQTEMGDTSNVRFALQNDFLEDYTAFKARPFRFDKSMVSMLEKRSLYAQIENSYYDQKRDSVINHYPGRFYMKPDKAYLLDAFTRFPTMEDVLREYVVEVIVRKKSDTYELAVMDGKTRLPFNGQPLILLDGVVVTNVKSIMDYDPQLLKKIEIVTKKYYLGPASMSGIVSFETFDGDLRKYYVRPENQFSYEGLQSSRKYYQPDYEHHAAELARIPDYRVQLLWNPNVQLNDHKATVSFFTPDVPGTYTLTVQGISKDGRPVQRSFTFHVTPTPRD